MPKLSVRGVAALALASCAVLMAGCTPTEGPDDELTVLTTFTVLQDIAQTVAGDHLRVESLTKPGTEIHGYEPTPGDLRRAAGADLILDNGLGLEAWFARFVEDLGVPHVVVTDGIETLPIAEDAYAGLDNPHAWMSPLNVQHYADNIAAALADLDPARADAYRANAASYKAQLQQVHDELLEDLAPVPAEQRVLVTCEGAFSYLARDAGLEEHYIWPVNAEQQATPQQIARTIGTVRARAVRAVFCESTVSDAPMRRVVEATSAEFGGVLYVDSLSEPGGAVPTYLDLIRHAAQTIAAGLRGEARGGDTQGGDTQGGDGR